MRAVCKTAEPMPSEKRKVQKSNENKIHCFVGVGETGRQGERKKVKKIRTRQITLWEMADDMADGMADSTAGNIGDDMADDIVDGLADGMEDGMAWQYIEERRIDAFQDFVSFSHRFF